MRRRRRPPAKHVHRPAASKAKNTAKNISLAVLTVLLMVLCVANWLTGVGVSQMPADSPLRYGYDRLFGGAVGYELRSSGIAAAVPSQVALSMDGGLYAVQYSPGEIDAALSSMQPLWTMLLNGLGDLQPAEEQVLADALASAPESGGCALIHYDGGIPLGIAAGWLGGRLQSDLPVRTLVYVAQSELVFVRAADGALYMAEASADSGQLRRAQESFHGFPCSFSGAEYAVWPETLLFEREALSLAQIHVEPLDLFEPQSGASLQTLLGAFSYTPYAHSYPEQGGEVRVFVSEGSTLRISRDGTVQFTAAGGSTVRAYEEGEAAGFSALDAQVDCARQVLDTAVRAAVTDTEPSLYEVQRDGKSATLTFLQTYSGVPVLGENDFATFVFQDGALVSATVYLQKFVESEVRQTVLPARQAAVGADGTLRGLLVAYRPQDGIYVPERFFLA